MKIKLDKRTIFEIVLVAIILILILILSVKPMASGKNSASIYFYTPDNNYSEGPYAKGSLVEVKDAPEIAGYTFAGWRDENGNILDGNSIYVNEDTYLSAVYSVAFITDEHIVFLENDNGIFRPDDELTNAEAAVMFYTLMDTNLVGTAEFEDVDISETYYKAAATLKDLGIISGNYFHPDEYVSRTEFAKMLKLFSRDYALFVENADSDECITRAEAAKIMCEILGREGDTNDNRDMIGTFLDVSPNRDDFWYIAESTLNHEFEYADGNEVWTESDSFDKYKPGFFFVGTKLHYIDANGDPVIDDWAENLYFNSRGEESSGDAEVDKYIQKILKATVDPSKQTKSEMLKILFDYMAKDNHFNYMVRNYYEPGDTSWVIDEAKVMLKTKKGNCYNFAAVFYELARAIGYDAKIYSGTMGTDYRPHSWVEIDRNGEAMLYDTEYQYAHPETNMFQRNSEVMTRYHYHQEGKPAEESTTKTDTAVKENTKTEIQETDKGQS